MKSLPLVVRVAAGLAASSAERVRELPRQLTGLPVTVVSQVLQLSMRVQQHVTELAIKGDDALSTWRPVEETPSWATFDEDLESEFVSRERVREPRQVNGTSLAPDDRTQRPTSNGRTRTTDTGIDQDEDPWTQEELALAEQHSDGEFDSESMPTTTENPSFPSSPAGIANYDELSLPQLRARLRQLSVADLEQLLEYERSHGNRPSFTGMLSRRIGNLLRTSGAEASGDIDNGATDK